MNKKRKQLGRNDIQKCFFWATETLLMYPQSVKKQTIILTQKTGFSMLSITHCTPFQKLIYNRKAFDSKDFSPNITPKADEKQ